MANATIIFQGRLTRDPEMRNTQAGAQFAAFNVAVDGDRQGDEATFYRVSVFGNRAGWAMQYLSKGKPVMVTGRLRASQYQGQDGQQRTSLEVTANSVDFTISDRSAQQGGYQQQGAFNQQPQQPQNNYGQQGNWTPQNASEAVMQANANNTMPFPNQPQPQQPQQQNDDPNAIKSIPF